MNFSLPLYTFITLLTSISYLEIGLFVFLKNPQKPLYRHFFLFCITVSLWALGYFITQIPSISYSTALLASRLSHSISDFIPILFFHFTIIFIYETDRKFTLLLKIGYFLSALTAMAALTPLIVKNVSPKMDFHFYPNPGPLYPLHIALFLIFPLVLAAYHLIKAMVRSTGTQRKRISYFAISVLLAFSGGACLFPLIYGFLITPHFSSLIILFPFAVTFTIIRYKEFDVEELAHAAQQSKLEAMGILSASINHELRNPLYIIKNFSESLAINTREGVYKDPQKFQEKTLDTLDRITRQSNQAMKIIGRLTAFARKKPDQDFKMVAVSLKELVVDLDILIRCEIETYKIEIVQDIPEDLPPVFADPAHLEEILLNLILNAYQVLKGYQTENTKKIYIKAAVTPQGTENTSLSVPCAQKIKIIIQDNGPGISPDDLPNIFKPFYTKKKEGLGLGLYITKQLVEKNQGTIKIESKPGQGAAFILTFEKASQ